MFQNYKYDNITTHVDQNNDLKIKIPFSGKMIRVASTQIVRYAYNREGSLQLHQRLQSEMTLEGLHLITYGLRYSVCLLRSLVYLAPFVSLYLWLNNLMSWFAILLLVYLSIWVQSVRNSFFIHCLQIWILFVYTQNNH